MESEKKKINHINPKANINTNATPYQRINSSGWGFAGGLIPSQDRQSSQDVDAFKKGGEKEAKDSGKEKEEQGMERALIRASAGVKSGHTSRYCPTERAQALRAQVRMKRQPTES